MSVTPSTMIELGTKAPDFALPDTRGNEVSLEDFDEAELIVVVFMCNHCPFVKHVRQEIINVANDYKDKGVEFVAINSNDVENHPEDSPKQMALEAEKYNYPFPYLYDESQEVAKKYRAACTPDFYVFDKDRKLVYRGQLDDSRPGNDEPINGKDLRMALDETLAGDTVSIEQKPSMGCNIKWKPGNQPDYAT